MGIISKLRTRFDALHPDTKRKLSIFLVVFCFGVIAYGLYQGRIKNREKNKKETEVVEKKELKVNFNEKKDEELNIENVLNKKLEKLTESLKEEIKKQNQQKEEEQKNNTVNMENAGNEGNNQNYPIIKAYPSFENNQTPNKNSGFNPMANALNVKNEQDFKNNINNVTVYKNVAEISLITIPENNKTTEKKQDKKGKINYIPSNSIFQATLITGVYAPTMSKGQQNPYPVVLRMKDLSYFPNEIQKDLSGCFVGGESYGSLSEERANIRLNKLSCMSKQGKKVLDQPIKGYVTGEDGMVGLPGVVVSKQGKALALAFVSNFLSGMGQAFSLANSTQSVTALGGTTQTVNPQDIVKFGAGSGFAESFKMLSKFYMDILKETSPVIEIKGGRDVELIISEGVDLKIDDFYWDGLKDDDEE